MLLRCHSPKSTGARRGVIGPWWRVLVLLYLCGVSAVSIAQPADDWLSHLHPEEAAAHGEAYQEHIEEILSGDDPEALQQLAVMSVFSNDWSVAAQAARQFRQTTERFDLVAIELSALAESGDAQGALDVLVLALEAPDSKWTGWAQLTQLLWAIPDSSKALVLLDALDSFVGSEKQPWVRMETRSRLMYQAGFQAEALDLAQTLLLNAPSPERVEWGLQLARDQGQLALALDMMDALSPKQQSEPHFAIWRAELLKSLDRVAEAISTLQATEPTPEVLFYLGTTAQAAGEDAIAKEAWGLLPVSGDQDSVDSKDAYYTAHLAQSLGYFGQAWTWFGRVTEAPWETEALLARGLLLNQFARTQGFESLEGSLQQVLIDLERVREAGDEQTTQQAWAIEALLLRQAKQSDRLVERLSQALAEDPDNEALLYLRALEALQLDRLSLAEQDLRRIIRVNRNNADALNALGYLLADRTQRFHEAHRLIDQALKLKPDSPEILDSMGWVNYRLGRLTLALDYLEKAHALNQDPEITAHLVEVLRARGEHERADALAGAPDETPISQ